ncbi:hypothetical protein MAR_005674 [Mya arenaria]|uniref:Uncharacterized protein n=1 Tax=Mya arenaria TaxID=6604 RepID=A0ABY7F2H4_MYAAR|nr:hypothetical protein MAR_005674 [Mya arenaria]
MAKEIQAIERTWVITSTAYFKCRIDRREQLKVHCIDATHLLTRTRRKCCRGGLDNSSKISWLNVAKTGKTMLTPIMVEEITDPMSSSMAASHFSKEVEREMRLLEDEKNC